MKIRILIVDDEKEIGEQLERHFRFLGYDAEHETNPLEAFERIQKENFQIVISDIRMPEMNGSDLLARIKRYNGTIKVIMMTGYVTQNNVMTCMRRGAETCLFKPFEDLVQLEEAVSESVLHLRRWQDILKNLHSMKNGQPA